MNTRENTLAAIRFQRPDWIPMTFAINPACWHHYDQTALQGLMACHPLLFPGFEPQLTVEPIYSLVQRAGEPFVDPWGCRWETTDNGITGAVHVHPLADWSAFDKYQAPDPDTTDGTFPISWQTVSARVNEQRRKGELVCGSLPHGHTFLRLQDIRGYESLILDMADREPRLDALIEMVRGFNDQYVQKWLELEPDMMSYPEDLGMQVGPMLSPAMFRRYIKPVYQALMQLAREQGCIVHMHSDGDIRSLADDLIEGGVEVINLQDLVNGVDWIAQQFAGRVCIDLDVDRQSVTVGGTPSEIDQLVRYEVATLGRREGGLMMVYGLYPGVPMENVAALMDAMERYAGYYA